MIIRTNSDRVQNARKVLYELLISDHNRDCLSCKRNTTCELQALGKLLGVLKNLDLMVKGLLVQLMYQFR